MGTEHTPAHQYENQKSLLAFEQARRFILVRDADLFAGLSSCECETFADLARLRAFHKGDILFAQGDPYRRLVLIDSGHVKLTLVNQHGKEVILGIRGKGDTVDLPVRAINATHTCSAQAVAAGRALSWTLADFERIQTRTPRLTENMYFILQHYIHDLEKRYHEAATEPVARRLACALMRLTEQVGVIDGKGVEIGISRQELAQMSGTTLFTVSRLISRWAELGLVVARREALRVLDQQGLDDITSPPADSNKNKVASAV